MTNVQKINYISSQELQDQFPEFQTLRIYGTENNPLFISQDILTIVGLKRFHFETYLVDRDLVKILVKHKDKNYTHIAFTERGLYKAILKSQTPLAEKFYDFVHIVMKDLRTTGIAELTAALNKLTIYETQIEQEILLKQKYKDESEKYYLKYNDKWVENKMLKDQMGSVPPQLNAEYKLQVMEKKYFKVLYVYISKPPKQIAADFEDWNPDIEPTDDDEICFKLSNKSRIGAVAEIRIPTYILISKIKETLKCNFSISLSDDKTHETMFRGTMEDLRNTIDTLIYQ